MSDRRKPNPFDVQTEPDRAEIWRLLVERDCAAFASGDWSMIERDFDADAFEGIVAEGSANPDRWTLRFPDLTSYREAWLEMSRTFRELDLPETVTYIELIHAVTQLHTVELAGDRALAHKKFFGRQPLSNGGVYEVCAQSLYRLRRCKDGQWRIVGFIGYLPWQRQPQESET